MKPVLRGVSAVTIAAIAFFVWQNSLGADTQRPAPTGADQKPEPRVESQAPAPRPMTLSKTDHCCARICGSRAPIRCSAKPAAQLSQPISARQAGRSQFVERGNVQHRGLTIERIAGNCGLDHPGVDDCSLAQIGTRGTRGCFLPQALTGWSSIVDNEFAQLVFAKQAEFRDLTCTEPVSSHAYYRKCFAHTAVEHSR